MSHVQKQSLENCQKRSEFSFFEKLERRISEVNSCLCVGIDPHMYVNAKTENRTTEKSLEKQEALMHFCKTLIEKTKKYVCCYKPNIAFFEAYGSEGIRVLEYLCEEIIPQEIPIILDAKRGDIDSTSEAYAYAYFGRLNVDAVTVNPYLGSDAILPFLKYKNKCVFVLCKTSNRSSYEVQNLQVEHEDGSSTSKPLYMRIADMCQQLRKGVDENNREICGYSDLGLVVAAKDGGIALKELRKTHQDTWFLIPGVGAQKTSLYDSLCFGLRADGRGVIVSISRAISNANDIEKAAIDYRNEINETIKKIFNGKEKQ